MKGMKLYNNYFMMDVVFIIICELRIFENRFIFYIIWLVFYSCIYLDCREI